MCTLRSGDPRRGMPIEHLQRDKLKTLRCLGGKDAAATYTRTGPGLVQVCANFNLVSSLWCSATLTQAQIATSTPAPQMQKLGTISHNHGQATRKLASSCQPGPNNAALQHSFCEMLNKQADFSKPLRARSACAIARLRDFQRG